ncbi:MAG: 1-deoxy-D-xylulose-5-phosphate synthase [Pseudomonadota bacterium]
MTGSNKKIFEDVKQGLLDAIELANRDKPRSTKTRIMYIEDKSNGFNGDARIGRVTFSKTGRSLTYRGRTFQRTKSGYKYNYFDQESGDRFWITGPRKDGADRLYPQSSKPVEIDEDVAVEYWRDIRKSAQQN